MPQSLFVTCNVDASFPNELGITGLGIVVRNSRGSFLFDQSSWVDGCFTSSGRGCNRGKGGFVMSEITKLSKC